jgi:hypothetical protein
MDASLTLAVPTFNRSRDAVRLAAQIAPWTEADGLAVSAVFYDDGSSDDTARSLERYRGPRLEVVRSDTNRGYARTLIRALSECDTEWVMLVADDDVFAPEPGHVEALMGWLAAERPDFVCTQWLTSDGGLYRGKDTTERITDADLRAAAAHAPGLIYRCSAVRQALPLLDRELERGSDAALVYPQVVLVAQMLAAGAKAMYWSRSLVQEGSASTSGITDSKGRTYWSASSRLAQAFAFDRLYRTMAREAPDREYRRHCRNFRADNELVLAAALKRVLRAHRPPGMSRFELLGVLARSGLALLRENVRRRLTRSAPTR